MDLWFWVFSRAGLGWGGSGINYKGAGQGNLWNDETVCTITIVVDVQLCMHLSKPRKLYTTNTQLQCMKFFNKNLKPGALNFTASNTAWMW